MNQEKRSIAITSFKDIRNDLSGRIGIFRTYRRIVSLISIIILLVLLINALVYFFFNPLIAFHIFQADEHDYHTDINNYHFSQWWIGQYKGGEFFYYNSRGHSVLFRPWYDGKLIMFNQNNMSVICDFREFCSNPLLIGMFKNYIYVVDYTDDTSKLYVYNVDNGINIMLYSGRIGYPRRIVWQESGHLYLPLMGTKSNHISGFIHVYEDIVLETNENLLEIKINETQYSIRYKPFSDDLILIGEIDNDNGDNTSRFERFDLDDRERAVFIPLLDKLIIYDDGIEDVIISFDIDGKKTILFKSDYAILESSILITHDYVFLSVIEKHENLSVFDDYVPSVFRKQATYRISLFSGFCEKISDNYYQDMFCFGNEVIQAISRNGIITQMDFDGQIK